ELAVVRSTMRTRGQVLELIPIVDKCSEFLSRHANHHDHRRITLIAGLIRLWGSGIGEDAIFAHDIFIHRRQRNRDGRERKGVAVPVDLSVFLSRKGTDGSGHVRLDDQRLSIEHHDASRRDVGGLHFIHPRADVLSTAVSRWHDYTTKQQAIQGLHGSYLWVFSIVTPFYELSCDLSHARYYQGHGPKVGLKDCAFVPSDSVCGRTARMCSISHATP